MLALIELPLLGYALAPDWTPTAVDRFKAWLARHGRRFGTRAAAVVGALLVIRALIVLLS